MPGPLGADPIRFDPSMAFCTDAAVAAFVSFLQILVLIYLFTVYRVFVDWFNKQIMIRSRRKGEEEKKKLDTMNC